MEILAFKKELWDLPMRQQNNDTKKKHQTPTLFPVYLVSSET